TVHAEERTNYPLTLSVDDLGEGFQLTALARVPIEPQQVCALMQMAVTQLLEALESAPQTPIRAINVLPEQEKQRQLVEWTAREAEYPQEKCIHELFEEQARRTPDALAVRYEDELVTYRQLNERSNRLAYSLRQQGVGAQSRVGICLGRSVELVAGVLGILKAGGAYVPLDPGDAAERLGYRLEDSAVELIVSQASVWSQVDWESGGVELGRVRCVPVDGEGAPEGNWSADPVVGQVSARNLACVMYESDRFGAPLGVMGSHVGLLAGALGRGEGSGADWVASLWLWPSGLLSGAGV